ncbi:MAG: hypothetical protein E4G91_04920 [Candidatus Zixiibacteriota bacterium]|nr:MAG: hypothetical protein E4G91_04920 [candidate division Zixibacteria bacterium]
MKQYRSQVVLVGLMFLFCFSTSRSWGAQEIVRPEEIKSKRQVIYDDATYAKLNRLWRAYYEEYPSEYAYANWMYAARYAGDQGYSELLAKGLSKYHANPVLLYLKALEQHGSHDDADGRKYLEKAVAIDQNYVDPWFALVTHYMDSGDEERLDLALRRLLESGIITDEVMDYNYNVLTSLDDNAILITNGDNDTYPAWILTRILKIRPDVAIVNRSLLNTDWYPMYVIDHGVPRFVAKSQLDELRSSILNEIKRVGKSISAGGPFGDTLILRLIESAELSGRPVYFARTVFVTDMLKSVVERGRSLGLVTLVSQSNTPFDIQMRQAYGRWIDSFRTGGLKSWRLLNASQTDAGRMIVSNYADGIVRNLEALKKYAPDLRLRLFRWYTEYVEGLLSDENRSRAAMVWCCDASDVKEIGSWSEQQGLKCEERVKQ